MQQYDEQLSYSVPLTKITSLIILQQNILMIIHHNFQYTVLKLSNPTTTPQILSHGCLPPLSCSIRKYGRTKIIYRVQNSIHVYDWIDKSMDESISIGAGVSEIYNNIFGYCLSCSEEYICAWKISSLNYIENYCYEIDVYRMNGLAHVRRYRMDYDRLYGVSLMYVDGTCNAKTNTNNTSNTNTNNISNASSMMNMDVVLYQTKGYNISILFLQSNIKHQIKSIYRLLLVSEQVTKENKLHLGFTHNQLAAGSKLCYEVDQQHVVKYYSQIQAQNVICFNDNYWIVHEDLIDNYRNKVCEIKVRVRYTKLLRSVKMLELFMNRNYDQGQHKEKDKEENIEKGHDKDKDKHEDQDQNKDRNQEINIEENNQQYRQAIYHIPSKLLEQFIDMIQK